MENQQPTNQELLEAIHSLKFDVADLRGSLKDLKSSHEDLAATMSAFATDTEKRLSKIESTMVTKEYLHTYMDEKLGLVVGRQNRKTEALVEQLVSEKSLSRPAADRILAMPPSLESR